MQSRSDKRRLREESKRVKFEACKYEFAEKVTADLLPKVVVTVDNNKDPRLAPHLVRELEKSANLPKVHQNCSRFSSKVSWCETKADKLDSWSWGEARAWSAVEWQQLIHPPFQDFKNLSWQEVDSLSSDSGHKMHHGHEVSDLISEAQIRWKYLNYDEFETIFRFRLGGKRRVWGYIVQAHFHIVWWDRDHSLYPTEPH